MAQRRVRITTNSIVMDAELNDSSTALQVWEALPLTSQASTWGDEIYFSIPIHSELENEQEIVELGDIAYWPPGNAFCIFFGPTPMSRGNEIRPASAVNVVGKLLGDATVFGKVKNGETVTLEQIVGR
ncbi:MAG: cyclophilin-like fold protein [Candidatus Poribacteria bacterium]|nr:cyclophilin-like fold protein [Candidatus Poribacteria bacterium]MDE0502725.1 cyclophilin-like fold protein [Candidatus Poribacteria bacterium]